MSGIIYGMLDLNYTGLANIEHVQSSLTCYQIDHYSEVKEEPWLFMGCGLLDITAQNKTETLPLYNKDKTQLITADVILDNRKVLYEAFDLNETEGALKSDSELILLAYDKWGEACPNYLLGDFSFVIWDKSTETIFCARDATGTRTFYYALENGQFYFGTVMKAIQAISKAYTTLDSEWLLNFLSTSIVLNQFDCESTPFTGIKQLPPAHSLTITKNDFKLQQYWNPLKTVKPLKLPNDEAYKSAFLKVFNEAVKCRLNTTGNVGLLLSGGLDSGSVACLAAQALAQEHKSLETFSSVPIPEYKDYAIPGRQADETEYIKLIGEAYPNIHQHYCHAKGEHAVSNLNYVLQVFEYPYKMLENIPWYLQSLINAREEGCKILLNGQYGNSTISYGSFLTQSLTLLHHGKWLSLCKEINAFSKHHHLGRKMVIKKVLSISVPYPLQKLLYKKYIKRFDYFRYSLLNPQLIQTHHLAKRLENVHFYQYPQRFCTLKQERQCSMNLSNFSQIASMEVKASLAQGLIIRDPTRDKRLIEFCLSLPGEQFMREGIERRLVRYSMKGILPEAIRCNETARGIQGADKLQRLQPYWQELYQQLEEIPNHDYICFLLNHEKYTSHLKALNHELKEDDWDEVKMFLIIYICDLFIKRLTA